MEETIARMLENYEAGKISRRQLIGSLTALTAGAKLAPGEEAASKGVGLNHIAIRVTNIRRSRDFYRKLLGLPVMHEAETDCFLGWAKTS